MKTYFIGSVLTLLLMVGTVAPIAEASTSTQSQALLTQLDVLNKQIEALKKQVAELQKTVRETQKENSNDLSSWNNKDWSLSSAESIRYKLCVGNSFMSSTHFCKEILKKIKDNASTTADFKVAVTIQNKATTTVTFKFNSKNYTATSTKSDDTSVMTSVRTSLGLTSRRQPVDTNLRTAILKKLAEVRNASTSTPPVVSTTTRAMARSVLLDVRDELEDIEDEHMTNSQADRYEDIWDELDDAYDLYDEKKYTETYNKAVALKKKVRDLERELD